MPDLSHATKIALFVAHPGHELRVFHWLESVQPRVYVLTDGSGRAGASRLDYTSQVLSLAGAASGGLYGRYTDRQVYDLLLRQDYQPLIGCVHELADDLVRHEIEEVVGDATEGFNPSHDICRLMIGAAIARASLRLQRPLITRSFPLHAAPSVAPPGCDSEPMRLELSSAALARKLAVARDYHPLAGELHESLSLHSAEAFRWECFWTTGIDDGAAGPSQGKPWYEEYAEQLVAAGRYQQIIRFQPHIQQFVQALRRDLKGRLAA